MDFVFIAVVDLGTMDDSGDMFKLYNYYERAENSGVVGMFITFLIQFAIAIYNVWIMY